MLQAVGSLKNGPEGEYFRTKEGVDVFICDLKALKDCGETILEVVLNDLQKEQAQQAGYKSFGFYNLG